jgi:hypothetical protein
MPKLYGGKEPGHGFNVSFSANEVAAFKAQWPCSGLPTRSVWFGYDSRGDLDDIDPKWSNVDSPALLALSHDGNAYAATRLKRPELRRGDKS